MTFRRVIAWLQTGDKAVVDMPPVIRRGVGRIEAECFHRVYGDKRALQAGWPETRAPLPARPLRCRPRSLPIPP